MADSADEYAELRKKYPEAPRNARGEICWCGNCGNWMKPRTHKEWYCDVRHSSDYTG
jgi:hypothetical protein